VDPARRRNSTPEKGETSDLNGRLVCQRSEAPIVSSRVEDVPDTGTHASDKPRVSTFPRMRLGPPVSWSDGELP
jgi:hypothetical protein